MLYKHTPMVGLAVVILGLTATLAFASAVTMTCSQVGEVWLGQGRGGSPIRTTCTMAKDPNGREVPVTLLDARIGETLHCEDNGGTITCPNTPLAAFGTRSMWYVPTPGLFRNRDTRPAWMEQQ
jgi:hypothetical protein